MANDTFKANIRYFRSTIYTQLTEMVKHSLALQVNEAIDPYKFAHLIPYVKFTDGEEMREEILFYNPVQLVKAFFT